MLHVVELVSHYRNNLDHTPYQL